MLLCMLIRRRYFLFVEYFCLERTGWFFVTSTAPLFLFLLRVSRGLVQHSTPLFQFLFFVFGSPDAFFKVLRPLLGLLFFVSKSLARYSFEVFSNRQKKFVSFYFHIKLLAVIKEIKLTIFHSWLYFAALITCNNIFRS